MDDSTVRQIEQLQPRVSVDLEDSCFVDSGLKFDGGATIAITNVTQANPGVVSLDNTNADGSQRLKDGDNIFIENVVGMTELNDIFYSIGNVTKTSLELRTFVEISSSPSSSPSASISSSASVTPSSSTSVTPSASISSSPSSSPSSSASVSASISSSASRSPSASPSS